MDGAHNRLPEPCGRVAADIDAGRGIKPGPDGGHVIGRAADEPAVFILTGCTRFACHRHAAEICLCAGAVFHGVFQHIGHDMGGIGGKRLHGIGRIVQHDIALLVRHSGVSSAIGEHTVIDERAVGSCHFPDRNAVCQLAEGHGSIGTVIRDKTRHAQFLDQIIVTGFRRQLVHNLSRDGIEGVLQSLKNRHQAVIFTAVILGEPGCAAQCDIRLVSHPGIRRDIAELGGRAVGCNGLKGRARGPLRAGGTVEGEVLLFLPYPAGESDNSAVIGIHHHDAALQLLSAGGLRDGIEILIDIIHSRLNIRIQAAVDLVSAVKNKCSRGRLTDASPLCQIIDHILDHNLFIIGVDLLDIVLLRRSGEIKRFGTCLLKLGIGDIALVIHLPEDRLLPIFVVFLAVEGIIVCRQVCDARNGSALCQAQFGNIFSEILLCGSLHPPATFSEIGHVEVPLHNLLFIIALFQFQRAENLLQFSLDSHLVIAGDVFQHLLSNG